MSNNDFWNNLPGPDTISRKEFDNGITVLVSENPLSPSVAFSGYCPGGSMYDPLDKLGLSQITSQYLMHGTQRYSYQQIYDSLEGIGASLGFGSVVHHVGFGGKCLSEDLPSVMGLLYSCLNEPVFPEEEFSRIKTRLLTGINMRDQDTGEVSSMAFEETLFKDHPYGRSESGYADTVVNIEYQDVAPFYQRYYTPRGMIICIAGAVNTSAVFDLVENLFSGWQVEQKESRTDLFPDIAAPKGVIRKHINLEGKLQADLVMGALGPVRKSPDYFPAAIGNNILGQFGMMGRIGESVREKAGLAYYAMSGMSSWSHAGSWEVNAGVNPANLEKAVDLILKEIHRFVSEPVSEEELQDSKTNFVGRIPLTLESNAAVASTILRMERFNLGLDYIQKYPQTINAITREQILETAKKYLDPKNILVISAGPELAE